MSLMELLYPVNGLDEMVTLIDSIELYSRRFTGPEMRFIEHNIGVWLQSFKATGTPTLWLKFSDSNYCRIFNIIFLTLFKHISNCNVKSP